MQQLHSLIFLKWVLLKYFSLPFTLLKPCGAVIIMNSKIHLRKNSLNVYFKTTPYYFCIYSFSSFITATRWTHWSFRLLRCSVNLPWQGFPASSPVGHYCVCSPLLFTPAMVISQHTVNRGWKKWAWMSTSRWSCCLETQMHNDVMLNGVIGICLWLFARQLPIPNQ